MTDNEIVKALECHAHRKERNLNCCDCDYIQHQDCSQRMSCDALDLINRQKAEIEKWKKNCDELYEQMSERQKAEVRIARRTGKAEAVKEFAEKVKANQRKLFNYIYSNDGFGAIIDNLVKEMVGDSK